MSNIYDILSCYIPNFAMNQSLTFVVINGCLSLSSIAFFIVGVLNWSSTNLGTIGWSYFTIDGNVIKIYVGLQGISSDIGTTTQYVSWQSVSSQDSTFSSCASAGVSTFSLVLISIMMTAVALVGTIMHTFNNRRLFYAICISTLGISSILSMAAFANWHINCFLLLKSDFANSLSGSTTLTSGEIFGFYAVVIGWISSVFAVTLEVYIYIKMRNTNAFDIPEIVTSRRSQYSNATYSSGSASTYHTNVPEVVTSRRSQYLNATYSSGRASTYHNNVGKDVSIKTSGIIVKSKSISELPNGSVLNGVFYFTIAGDLSDPNHPYYSAEGQARLVQSNCDGQYSDYDVYSSKTAHGSVPVAKIESPREGIPNPMPLRAFTPPKNNLTEVSAEVEAKLTNLSPSPLVSRFIPSKVSSAVSQSTRLNWLGGTGPLDENELFADFDEL